MNALELRGLTKHYKDFTLGPLNLTLPGGTICGLIGENGAGKSTTIRLILDMVQRDGGTVTILGRDSRTASVRTKEEIGVVLGSEGIPLCLNAVEVGKVMAGSYHNWDAAAYTELCQKFGLPDKKQYKDYSTAYKDAMNGNMQSSSITDLLPPGYTISETQLKELLRKRKDTYRRYRDLSIFAFIGVYLLAVIDAYVDAELSNFDITPDLSMKVEPAVINTQTSNSSNRSVGLQCSFRL